MQNFADIVESAIRNYLIGGPIIQYAQGRLNEEMRPKDWISFILSNRECVVLKFNNGEFMNEGYVVNDEKVLKVFGNHQIGAISYSEEQSIVEEGIVDLDHGSRFEGLVLTDEKGKMGIPFGYGEMYDDDGLLLYKGIMINWKRFGYGTSYHDNGLIEYEGYWCDDNRFGIGKLYDRKEQLQKNCCWYNGNESDNGIEYCGNGSEPMNIGIKHLGLTDNYVFDNWDVSWLLNLESIKIYACCYDYMKTFKIDGLNRLKTIKIGSNSFTQKREKYENDESKSFHILNCESLKSIQISKYSFSDFGGEFELKNLPQLQSIEISSCNFYHSSFVIRGIDVILNIVMIRSTKFTIHYIG